MNEERKTEGLPWGSTVIANIDWEGQSMSLCLNDRMAY